MRANRAKQSSPCCFLWKIQMQRSHRIWVIDDDRSIRWVLEKALQKAGMEVTTYSNANGIMEALSREQPDAIVSDVRMPGIDGLSLLVSINEQYPNLPVIIMTAHSDLDSAVTASQRRLQYLPKPFDINNAIEQVTRACRKSRGRTESSEESAAGAPEIIGEAPAMQEVSGPLAVWRVRISPS